VLDLHGVENAAVGIDTDEKGVFGNEVDHDRRFVLEAAGKIGKRKLYPVFKKRATGSPPVANPGKGRLTGARTAAKLKLEILASG
jgi:hypothetical protein